jgi:hypothetical protein
MYDLTYLLLILQIPHNILIGEPYQVELVSHMTKALDFLSIIIVVDQLILSSLQ